MNITSIAFASFSIAFEKSVEMVTCTVHRLTLLLKIIARMLKITLWVFWST